MQSHYITPAITVFDEQGRLDPEGNFRLYDFIKSSVSGFVVMGSTGEFFSLDMKTSRQVIQMAAEFPREGIKAYAGTSRMDIDECVELANYADECGLDGVMIISPWYFRLTDEGIYTFYSQIARRTAAKIFIYNFPERTGYFLLMQHGDEVFLCQRPPVGLWGGLFCFPQFEDEDALRQWLAQRQIKADNLTQLTAFRHTFSHFHLDIVPMWLTVHSSGACMDEGGALWYNLAQPPSVGLAAPVERLLQQLKAGAPV